MVGVAEDAVDGADLHALRGVIVTDTLRTKIGVNDVDLWTHADGVVGAFRLADIAIDTLIVNE
jgi:hypothetical protein